LSTIQSRRRKGCLFEYSSLKLNIPFLIICHRHTWVHVSLKYVFILCVCFLFFFVVLGLELRAFTLSHSTSPFLWRVLWDRVSQTICGSGLKPQSSWSLLPE
jgi:hypothetical protein